MHHPPQRRFTPSAPNRLWVADMTYVSTWSSSAPSTFPCSSPGTRSPRKNRKPCCVFGIGSTPSGLCCVVAHGLQQRRLSIDYQSSRMLTTERHNTRLHRPNGTLPAQRRFPRLLILRRYGRVDLPCIDELAYTPASAPPSSPDSPSAATSSKPAPTPTASPTPAQTKTDPRPPATPTHRPDRHTDQGGAEFHDQKRASSGPTDAQIRDQLTYKFTTEPTDHDAPAMVF